MLCRSCFFKRLISFSLIVIGIILLICFMPYWLWLAILGLALIIVGSFILVKKFY